MLKLKQRDEIMLQSNHELIQLQIIAGIGRFQ